MFNNKLKRAICVMSSAVMVASTAVAPVGAASNNLVSNKTQDQSNTYVQRFLDLYNKVKDSNNGYFDKNGIPYHSIETLMVEAPDQGHETTSEAASYLIWLEAMAGEFTGDYNELAKAWDVVENYYIPTAKDQPGQTDYNASSPATPAYEFGTPEQYPSKLMFDKKAGQDPLYSELKNTYNTPLIYGMHWLVDVDNFYGFGTRGDGTTAPSYINTYQRGCQESVFETIPQPCWEAFKFGGSNGFLDLFTIDNSYSQQWKYTNAPDADARLIQAMWSARNWAEKDGVDISSLTDKATKMGDYLRYSMFDKYFMKIGAQGMTPATGRDSQHYLLSWYYAWGGSTTQSWSWRIGCSHSHFGYQNPFAAYVLSQDDDFQASSATAVSDWDKSLDRQIELYTWLQSSEGAIAGGCTNSYNGAYETYPAGTSTFYGMAYTEHPVYHDPGSNRWFGMQAWSMQRMCEYYFESGDERVKDLVYKWANWAESEVTVGDKTFAIPSNLIWSGQPDTWNEGQTISGWANKNQGLHVEVESYGEDVGIAGSLANALLYVAAAKQKEGAADWEKYYNTATGLLDCLYENYTDDKGVASEGVWDGVKRFFGQEVYVPSSWSGTMPNGDQIKSGVTFIDIRSNYKDDVDYERALQAYKNGTDFTTNYHRFWAQVEVAVAYGVAANLFGDEEVDPTTPPTTETPVTTEPSGVTETPVTSETPVSSAAPVVSDYDLTVTTNMASGSITVTNTKGNLSVNDVTVRYYFKSEGSAADVVYLDNIAVNLKESPWYANINGNTTAKVVKMSNATATADSYIEFTFSGANYNLANGATLTLGARLCKADWSNMDFTNDYSNSNGAVVLVNGAVVSGNIPA